MTFDLAYSVGCQYIHEMLHSNICNSIVGKVELCQILSSNVKDKYINDENIISLTVLPVVRQQYDRSPLSEI